MREVKCPHCGNLVTWSKDSAWKPFCSERCRLIDLGNWASEKHSIPGEPHYLPEDNQTQTED